MNNDDLFNYLVATNQLDEFLGYEVPKCPESKNELKELEDDDSKLYCSNCNIVYNKKS